MTAVRGCVAGCPRKDGCEELLERLKHGIIRALAWQEITPGGVAGLQNRIGGASAPWQVRLLFPAAIPGKMHALIGG